MKWKGSAAQTAPQPATRQTDAVTRPRGKDPDPQVAGAITSDHTPRDATGINPEDMAPIDPRSPYIPPP